MTKKAKVAPFEVAPDSLMLSSLPGDEPNGEPATKGLPPQEIDLQEVQIIEGERQVGLLVAMQTTKPKFWSRGTVFALFLSVSVAGFLTYEAARAVSDALSWWAPSGIALGLLLAGTCLTGMLAAGSEVLAIRRQMKALGNLEAARRQADKLMQSQGHDEGVIFAARVIRNYGTRPDMAEPIAAFRQAVNSSLRDQEVIARLSSHVLRHLDDQARAVVGRAMRDTAFLSLASPNGLVDALIVIWRELRMLREIGVVYGLAPGMVQQWALLRRVISIAATSGLANQAGDMIAQSLGGGFLRHLWANATDSLYTVLRTARLGMYAMESCRPVTFRPEERKGTWNLLTKATVSIASLLPRSDGVAESEQPSSPPP